MRFARRAGAERVVPLELAPMIDVVFLLIIFFMTTARFAEVTRAQLDLPQEEGEREEESVEAGLVINVDRDGTFIVDQEELDLAGLDALVQAEIDRTPGRSAAHLKLMIRADRNADTGRLNELIGRLEQRGVGAARLATEVP